MIARRMLLAVAILMGVTALTAGLAAPPERRGADERPPAPRSPGERADAGPVERIIDATAPPARTVSVAEGAELRLTVEVDAPGSVELVGLDRLVVAAPGTPAVFAVLADRPGLYPVVLREADRRLGALRVNPARE